MATKKVKAKVSKLIKTSTVPSKKQGAMEGDERKTYIVNSSNAAKIDAIAYWDRKSIKEVVNEAFADRIAKYEKLNGPVKVPAK